MYNVSSFIRGIVASTFDIQCACHFICGNNIQMTNNAPNYPNARGMDMFCQQFACYYDNRTRKQRLGEKKKKKKQTYQRTTAADTANVGTFQKRDAIE